MNREAENAPQHERERQKAIAVWRAYGEDAKKVHRLDKSLDTEVGMDFENCIITQFWNPILKQLRDQQVSGRKLAMMIGVDASTPTRWMKRDWRKRTQPDLKNFLFTAVAADIDFANAGFPAGHDAALAGYCAAFDSIAKRIDTEQEIAKEEALSLHFIARSWGWLVAMKEQSEEKTQFAAAEIIRQVQHHFDADGCIRYPDDVRGLLERRMVAWAILETMIQYEWFS